MLAPVLTPFTANLDPDWPAYLRHCRWLLENGAGLAIFGTNSEAASLSVDERVELTDRLLDAGIPASRLMPGTGSCALTDTVRLTRHAVEKGAGGVLVLPPFYFKGVSEDGLFAYYAEVIERVGDSRLAVYLYHIPQLTQVPISLSLIERLLKRYPQAIAGAKDSSGDWGNSRAMIDQFSSSGFDVFPASESLLSKALPLGGAGCISATVNVNPHGIQALYAALTAGDERQASVFQADADKVRQIYQSSAMIPAMKYTLAEAHGHSSWAIVRPPLVPMQREDGAALLARLDLASFSLNRLQ
ncbi:dihydrodipicolinate synthase family protein [Cupriavidus sp. IDO]|nr:dihydrodipicolinate synthase family protein [Cupriavidus sp. IDO]KWR90727.1 dihydrodipicolinate synthase family protein [Cupriavidus sp. IDO]